MIELGRLSPKAFTIEVGKELERGFWNDDDCIINNVLDRVLNNRALLLKFSSRSEEESLKTFGKLVEKTATKVLDDISTETKRPIERHRLVICTCARIGAREYSKNAQQEISKRLKMLGEAKEMRKDYASVIRQIRNAAKRRFYGKNCMVIPLGR